MVPELYRAMSMLLVGNSGDPWGTKATPSGPPPMFTGAVTVETLKVPDPSGVRVARYQLLVLNEAKTIWLAPGKPDGMKPTAPTDEATPSGVRSITLSGAVLQAWFVQFDLRNIE